MLKPNPPVIFSSSSENPARGVGSGPRGTEEGLEIFPERVEEDGDACTLMIVELMGM